MARPPGSLVRPSPAKEHLQTAPVLITVLKWLVLGVGQPSEGAQ